MKTIACDDILNRICQFINFYINILRVLSHIANILKIGGNLSWF